MNVNQPNRSAFGSSAATARVRETTSGQPAYSAGDPAISASDGHLAELLRSLRSLAGDSPERQAKIEGLMLAYAGGNLQVDAEATASAMIDDAVSSHLVLR
ncbi:MAG: hypothetical protein ABI833_14085 [Acidobacteriota bacterium]